MIKKVKCRIVTCDGCGDNMGLDFVPHVPIKESVQEEIDNYNWEYFDNNHVYCEYCRDNMDKDCDRCNHDWEYHVDNRLRCRWEEWNDMDALVTCRCRKFKLKKQELG